MRGGDLAFLENHQGRQAANAIFRGGHRIVIDIDFGDFDIAAHLVGNGIQMRGHGFTWATPFGPEIDNDGRIARDGVIKCVIGDMLCSHNDLL